MIIEGNGIRLDVVRDRNVVRYRVLEQSEAATNTLKFLGHLRDPETGFSIRSNQRPSYSKVNKRFFVRGTDAEKNDKRVKITFDTIQEAINATWAIERLVNEIIMPEIVDVGHNEDAVMTGQALRGGTTDFRFRFINRAMAKRLRLTGYKLYPVKVLDWEPCDPPITANAHWNSHCNQALDILSKSIENPLDERKVMNPHRATVRGSKTAVALLRDYFRLCYENDCIVEGWRLASYLRGPDENASACN